MRSSGLLWLLGRASNNSWLLLMDQVAIQPAIARHEIISTLTLSTRASDRSHENAWGFISKSESHF